MRGSKRERRPGVWELRVPLGRDPLTGRPLQKSETFHGKSRAAENRLAKLVSETDGKRAPSTDATLGALLDKWLAQGDRDLEPTTMREYRRHAETMRTALGTVKVRKLTGRHFDDLYDALIEEGRSAHVCVALHRHARIALNEGVRWGWLAVNPVLSARPPKYHAGSKHLPTVAELALIVEQASLADTDLGTLLWVAAALGGRRGEVIGLRWSAVDLGSGRIHIWRNVVDLGGTSLDKDTKTHQDRHVLLGAGTTALLSRHYEAMCRRARAEAPGGVLVPDAYVFSREPDGSGPLKPASVSQAFRRAVKLAGLERPPPRRIQFKNLRHLSASLLTADGIPLAVVSARLGHDRQSTTSDFYNQAMPGGDRLAADTLDRLLGR